MLDVRGARLLARAGATALAQRWFGQPGLPAEIRDVPLELVPLLGRSRRTSARYAHVRAPWYLIYEPF